MNVKEPSSTEISNPTVADILIFIIISIILQIGFSLSSSFLHIRKK